MRIPYLLAAGAALFTLTAHAVETEIENDVPITAEATTDVVPGKAADVQQTVGQPAPAVAPKPDRIYTDGALANPNAKAEDLGLASPGQKMMVDTSGDASR